MTVSTHFSQLVRRYLSMEDGAIAITLAVMLPAMLGMAALVEATRVYSLKNQLQATADAAAMASVREDPQDHPDQVRSTANELAELNMPYTGYGDVLLDIDIKMGHWNPDLVGDARFQPGIGPADAVQVTTRGMMPLFIAGALRKLNYFKSGTPTSFTPTATAVALLRPDKCYSNGFVAGGTISMNSSNTFKSGFCVYGHDGVSMTSSNFFEAGTGVGMSDLETNWTALEADFHQNDGLEEALFEKYVAPPAATTAQLLIADLIAGKGPMGHYELIPSWPPATIVSGKLYRVVGAVVINQKEPPLPNVGIISDTSITVKAGSRLLSGVTLGSPGAVNIDSNVVFGDANFCTTGEGQSIILSGTDVTGQPPLVTNSNIHLYGVQMISDGTIEMNSNLKILGGSIQSAGDIIFNSRFDVAGCPDETSPSPIHGETKVSQLVD